MRNLIIAFLLVSLFAACDSADKRTTDNDNDGVVRTDADKAKDDIKKDKDDDGLFGGKKNDNDKIVSRDNKDRDDNNLKTGEDKIDRTVAAAGRTIFMSQCITCHKVSDAERKAEQSEMKKEIDAPDLSDITDKRSDRFLMKFMTNTDGTDNDNAKNKEADDVCLVQKQGKDLNRDKALKVLEYLHMQANKD